MGESGILTPDQRLRVFISSTLGELEPERAAARRAVEGLHLSPVLFELGARPHPPQSLYRAYLAQSHVFVGIYWRSYGWVAPDEDVSGIEDEWRLAGDLPRLLYVKEPDASRDPRLEALIAGFEADDRACYRFFSNADELEATLARDLALLLTERFRGGGAAEDGAGGLTIHGPPVPLTRTVGRAADVAALEALLRGGARLLTVTGAGGIGKSRLALEVCRRVADHYPDGVALVPLAAVHDPAQVAPTVAEHLGVHADGSQPVLDALVDALGSRRVLLLVDNFEQVTAAGPDLGILLDACPHLCAVVTSRHVLRLRGEREYPLAPLEVPEPGTDVDELRGCAAVELFVDRAQAVRPDFALVAENAAAVTDLCRRLDGLPLALELAAARTRLLPPDQLLRRLAERLDLLAGGATDLPARQQTLRATIDWSHALLDADEQALFARLSVFVGGWTLEAAEAVCGHDVLDTLASLLEKSLLLVADEGDAGPRLRMLQTVAEYAWERLADRGESADMTERHLAWVRGLTEAAWHRLQHMPGPDWQRPLLAERENIRAAIDRAVDADRVDDAVGVLWPTTVFWWRSEEIGALRRWVERLWGRPCTPESLARLAATRCLVGEETGAFAWVREAAPVALAHGGTDPMPAAMAGMMLAIVQEHDGHDDAAAASLTDVVEALGDHVTWLAAYAESIRGAIHARHGAWSIARDCQLRALELAARSDALPLASQVTMMLGHLDLAEGLTEQAAARFVAAAQGFRERPDREALTYVIEGLAFVALTRGHAALAARAAGTVAAVRARLGVEAWSAMRGFSAALETATREALGDLTYAREAAGGSVDDIWTVVDRLLVVAGAPAAISTVPAAPRRG